ncbi:MAG: GGDEF domain-containing protein [Actinomycetota bacterium]|nr:GGDEF domain-containing protein [Actinomycetota bacterium]
MSQAWGEGADATAILDALASHAAILNSSGSVLATNRAWAAFAADHPGDPWRPAVGENYVQACEQAANLGSEQAAAVADAVRSVLAGSRRRFHVDYQCAAGDDELWFTFRASALAVEGGGALITHDDITSRKRVEIQLVHQALHDGLTGLPNRTLFLDRLSVAMARMGRSAATVAVLFLDLDNLKEVNDSLGHEVGDQVLVAVANRLRAVLRPGDTAARHGGDEFTILCEGLASENDAVAIAERVNAAVRLPFTLTDVEISLTASIGMALAAGNRSRPESLIGDADTAMYRAKQRGKGRYELFSGAPLP